MSSPKRQPTLRHDYRPSDYLIDTVDLDFDLGDGTARVAARLRVRRHEDAAANAPLRLDGEDLHLVSIAIDGRPLADGEYRQDATGLTIAEVPATFELATEVRINPAVNTRLEGLYLSKGVFCTQCEAEGFRRITFFIDRPDVMATYRTVITADRARCPVLLSNGNLVASEALGDGRHRAVWEDPFRKPCYLFALVAGNLAAVEDRFRTASGRDVTLRIHVEPGKEDRCGWAMESLKRAMRWDEEVFGLEYDLDVFNIVAVSDFNMGAMENKSLNVFNDKYILASPKTSTDADYAAIEAVIAHEYFHNWTGDRVTCRDWFQLSLKEGLTVFRDQEFAADMRSRPVQRIRDVRQLRGRQFPEDAGPLAHPVRPDSYIEINNFYTATIYEKGAEVVRLLHTMLGPAGFRAGMDLYFRRHDGQAVTCDDFVRAMADANARDLSQFMLWYAQAGTPEITATGHYDAASRTWQLDLMQRVPPTPGQPEKLPMPIPLAVGLLDAEGREIPLRLDGEPAADGASRVLMLDQAQQSFRFRDLAGPPVPSLNRGFSAPVRLEQPLSDSDRLLLLAHDSDPFSRWEAGQQYAVKLMIAAVEAIGRGERPAPADDFADALGRALVDPDLDRAFLAELIALPGEAYVSDQLPVVDPQAVHAARRALRRSVAERLRETLLAAYHGHRSNADFQPTAAEAGRRAVKNGVLGYLAVLPDPDCLDLVWQQYEAADNMTDRVAALGLLTDIEAPARQAAFDDFYRRYRDEPLVLDKWLMLQAISALPGTLDRIRELMRHPAFVPGNPNKVRALVGGFTHHNPLHFHAADGAGYVFLADRVLDIDRSNPQLAAQLLGPLGRWRRFDERRQQAMRTQLQRIIEHPELSPDVYELAAKALA